MSTTKVQNAVTETQPAQSDAEPDEQPAPPSLGGDLWRAIARVHSTGQTVNMILGLVPENIATLFPRPLQGADTILKNVGNAGEACIDAFGNSWNKHWERKDKGEAKPVVYILPLTAARSALVAAWNQFNNAYDQFVKAVPRDHLQLFPALVAHRQACSDLRDLIDDRMLRLRTQTVIARNREEIVGIDIHCEHLTDANLKELRTLPRDGQLSQCIVPTIPDAPNNAGDIGNSASPAELGSTFVASAGAASSGGLIDRAKRAAENLVRPQRKDEKKKKK